MRVGRDGAATCAGRDRHTAGTEACCRLHTRCSQLLHGASIFGGSVGGASDPRECSIEIQLPARQGMNRTFFALLRYSIDPFGVASALIDRGNRYRAQRS